MGKYSNQGKLCDCGDVEDTQHYLLACEQYRDLRQDLINIVSTICQPSLNILLYGNTDLSENDTYNYL